MNKYERQFKDIMNPTALLNKMWKLLDRNPADKDLIINAFTKQNSIITKFETNHLSNYMTEY